MEESKKRNCEESENEEAMKKIRSMEPDRLSSLPDTLLVSILALLPTQEVARTCVLSKRWRNVWSTVPSFCFDLQDCNNDYKRFKDFVAEFLPKRDGTIDTHEIRVSFNNSEKVGNDDHACTTSHNLYELTEYAVKHNAKSYEVSYKGCSYCHVRIPGILFACKTLEHVKFNLRSGIYLLNQNVAIHLPRLRTLDLTRLRLQDGQVENILSRCPTLKHLILSNCELIASGFSCHGVKRLELYDPDVWGGKKPLTINVPSVENLVFINKKKCTFFLKSTSKLTHAIWLDESGFGEQKYGCHVLNSLSGVKDLEISSYYTKFFEEGEKTDSPTQDGSHKVDNMDISHDSRSQSDNAEPAAPRRTGKCPVFKNLKSLVIRELSVCCHFAAWTSIFQYCPNLEELHFMPDGKLCVAEDEHLREHMKPMAKFPFKGLKKIGIIYDEHSRSVSLLESLIKEWMKDATGVEVILTKKTVSLGEEW